jgi:hypothetical protein
MSRTVILCCQYVQTEYGMLLVILAALSIKNRLNIIYRVRKFRKNKQMP